MRKLINLISLLCILFSSCKTVKTDKNPYPWLSFDKNELTQSVNLKEYADPNFRPGQDTNKVVILCASGGGARAAALSIGIMLELEKILYPSTFATNTNVLNEIDFFSTVSGGGWGVSAFIAHQYQTHKYSDEKYKQAILNYNSSQIDKRSNENNLISLPTTFNETENYLLNISNFNYYDRQIRLIPTMGFGSGVSDRSMTKNLNDGYLGWINRMSIEQRIWPYLHPESPVFEKDKVLPILLGDIFKPQGEMTYLPLQIANTTNIDNFSLVPFSPDRLKHWGVTNFHHYQFKSKRLSDTLSISGYDSIPFASGTKASGGIPYFLSASSFRTNKLDGNNKCYYLHIQDGGIVDQQAMHSAKAILNAHEEIEDSKNRIVLIVDASSSGISINSMSKRRKAGRTYNVGRVMAPFATPDAQYILTRERIKLFEKEYNCTVIYLGVDVLLDSTLNPLKANLDQKLPNRKNEVTKYFCNKYYNNIQNNDQGFLKIDLNERKLLYSYISQNISTWFNSIGENYNGKVMRDKPQSTATIMFLAGRGIVQLKRGEIESVFKISRDFEGGSK